MSYRRSRADRFAEAVFILALFVLTMISLVPYYLARALRAGFRRRRRAPFAIHYGPDDSRRS